MTVKESNLTLRLSGSLTQLNKEARSWRVRSKRRLGAFTGLHVSFSENGTYWRKWWLRKDSLLLFVTYNCSVENQSAEYAVVDQMVAALKPKAPAA